MQKTLTFICFLALSACINNNNNTTKTESSHTTKTDLEKESLKGKIARKTIKEYYATLSNGQYNAIDTIPIQIIITQYDQAGSKTYTISSKTDITTNTQIIDSSTIEHSDIITTNTYNNNELIQKKQTRTLSGNILVSKYYLKNKNNDHYTLHYTDSVVTNNNGRPQQIWEFNETDKTPSHNQTIKFNYLENDTIVKKYYLLSGEERGTATEYVVNRDINNNPSKTCNIFKAKNKNYTQSRITITTYEYYQ